MGTERRGPGAVSSLGLEDMVFAAIPLPRLTPEQDELLRVAFEELIRTGEPVPVAVLSGLCRSAGVDAAHHLEQLAAAGRVGRGEDGSVTGALGLTVDETPHETIIEGTRWHTWCAIDALGILGALGASGTVRSRAPGTGRIVEVWFSGGRLSGGDLDCVVFVPEYRKGTPVVRTWCPSVNFFLGAAAAEQWAAANSVPGWPVPLATATVGATRRWRARLRPA